MILPLDLTQFDTHQKSVNKVLDHFGKVNNPRRCRKETIFIFFFTTLQINVMLHNAGRSQRARWEHTDIEVDLDLFNLNVFSIVNLSRCIMPHFLERNSGTFALMSSTAGKAGVPFSGSYTGSKHALHVRNMTYIVLDLDFVAFFFFEISRHFVFVLICQSCPMQQLTFTKTRPVL